jgi:hypothetical protein
MRFGFCRVSGWCVAVFIAAPLAWAGDASGFHFHPDTLAFANSTVFAYQQGKIVSHGNPDQKEKSKGYTRRCFVMSRTVVQFYKFARFDPHASPVDDNELVKRVRAVTRNPPWHPALPPEQRIVFPGYRDLRELSQARTRLLQRNIGLGWTAYVRPGNFRMFYLHSKSYQEKTHAELERALDRGDFFVAFLSDFPTLHINHSVLVYAHKKARARDGTDRYLCYDSNHPDGPRELTWIPAKRAFEFQKDEEFVGGFARVFHVYGKWLQ